ncbi:MAG: ABC transporter permease [Bacteroidota bacterium]
MIRNYLKISIRNLKRHLTYSLINVLGLAISITAASLIFLHVQDEFTFDAFHSTYDRTYRVIEVDETSEGTRFYGRTAPPLGQAFKDEVPGVETATNLYQWRSHIDLVWKGERLSIHDWYHVDSNFFKVFDYQFILGNSTSALVQSNSAVLTESAAKRFFGDEEALGKVMEFASFDEVTVTGVIKDPPGNSHLQFDILVNHNTGITNWPNYAVRWDRSGANTYFVLEPNARMEEVNAAIPAFLRNHQISGDNDRSFYLQALKDIHFHSEQIEMSIAQHKGSLYYAYLFVAIGIFILLIASINYLNLVTAMSASRAREIGIRKASGAERWQLIGQFLSESLVVALLAFLVAVILIDITIPFFNQLIGKELTLRNDHLLYNLAWLFGLTLLLGLFSGVYPAFYLSGLRPMKSLKSESINDKQSATFRQLLVVTQFSLSIAMIVVTLVVQQQLEFVQNKALGYEEEQILAIDINNRNARQQYETMKNELSKVSGVRDVAVASRIPGEWKNIHQVYTRTTALPEDSLASFYMAFDESMIPIFDLELGQGRNFQHVSPGDSSKVILNRKAVQMLGLEDPVGASIFLDNVDAPFEVIGVLEDFHFQSLYEPIAPLIVGYIDNPITYIDYFIVEVSSDNINATLEDVKSVHEYFDPVTPIDYHFLDEQRQTFYENDRRVGNFFSVGAGLTIFIACLGVFGMASFIIQKRTKEIGIRKLLGASIADLLILISKSFVKQIVIATIIATPLAWWLTQDWLNYFAYKTSVGWSVFLVGGGIALFIALATVSYRAIKAVLINPAETLRTE